MFESLEQRVLLATIMWDGGPDGTGTNFHDPVNWVGDVLPGSEDDAVIPTMPGSPVIVISQSTGLRSLVSEESINHIFGTLAVFFPSSLHAGYTLEGGTIQGSGDLTVSGEFDWRDGQILGPGSLTIESDGELRMNDLSFGDLGRSVVNHGTVSQDDALLTLLSGASLTNHGLWTVSGGGAINNSGAVPMFTNTGTLRRVTGGPAGTNFGATTNGQVVNSGAIEVFDGMLSIGGAGGSNSGTVTIAAGATLNLWAPWSHAAGSVIQGGGLLDLSVMGTQTITGSTTWSVAEVSLGGGGVAIGGPGTLIIGGLLDWRAGQIQGPGGLTIQSGGELRMNDLSFGDLGRSVVNHGTVSQDDALLTLLSGASLTNHGLWTVSGGGAINNSGAVPMFTNTGTLRRVAGGPVETNFGATTNGQVVNSGAIEVLDGMLLIGGAGGSNSGTVTIAADALLDLTAGWTHNTGSSIAGSGTLFIQSVDPQSIAGASEWSVASIVLSDGTIAGPATLTVNGSMSWESGSLVGATLAGSGDIEISGDVTFASGSISGSGSLGGTGTMRFEGPGATTLNRDVEIGRIVMMGGTIDGSGAVTVANELDWGQGTLGGSAPVTILFDAVLMFAEGTLATTLVLEGTMTVTGSGDLSFAGGTLVIAEDGTLNWFGTGSLINGSGVNQVLNHGRIEMATSSATVLVGVPLENHAGAFLIVSSHVTLSGGGFNAGVISVWSEASLLRFESAFAHQTGSDIGGSGHFVIAAPQTINGLTTWWATAGSIDGGSISGSGNLSLIGGTFAWSGGTISGPGTLSISAEATLEVVAASATLNRVISNSGTVHVVAGSTLFLPMPGQTSGGLFLADAGGTIDLSGSTFTHTGGSRFEGAGTLQIGNSTQTIAASSLNWKIARMVHSDGMITGTGWLYVWGDLEWTGGQITNSGRLSTWAFGRILVQHEASLSNTLQITNFGTLVVEPGHSLTLLSAPTNLVGSTLFQGNWEIHGTLLFPEGREIRSLNADVRLVSPGASVPAMATLELLTSNSGAAFSLLDGATLTVSPATGEAINRGSMTISAGSLLTINGAFVADPTSSIEFGLAGTGPSQYGRITATGSLTINGHIGITLSPGYTPAPTVTYNLITGGSPRTGIFQTESLPAAAPGQLYFVGHSTFNVALLHVLPAFWDGGATGLGTNWHDPLNWVGDV
ncbi:MAG: hypothetical protein KF699_05405, partial [Phycisphaeraceae bacterium]|nr:hypothetical protein [Phycisphaeraceae bacterium]